MDHGPPSRHNWFMGLSTVSSRLFGLHGLGWPNTIFKWVMAHQTSGHASLARPIGHLYVQE